MHYKETYLLSETTLPVLMEKLHRLSPKSSLTYEFGEDEVTGVKTITLDIIDDAALLDAERQASAASMLQECLRVFQPLADIPGDPNEFVAWEQTRAAVMLNRIKAFLAQ
jgi:hypothetical protein